MAVKQNIDKHDEKNRYLIANWKMNPVRIADAKMYAGIAKKRANRCHNVITVICPAFTHIYELAHHYSSHRLFFGAQDCFWEEKGARTGEISPHILKDIKAQYVIIGHSERRTLGENNEQVNKKMLAALSSGLKIILCVGESERDPEGMYLAFLKEEILSALDRVSRQKFVNVIIAYEPIWAVGEESKGAMTPRDVHETTLYIRKILREKYGEKAAFATPILYGGSVSAQNTSELIKGGEIQGLLVGRKSLEPKAFGEIMKIVNEA